MIGRECLDVVHEIRRFKDPPMREHPHARGIIKCNRARQLMIAADVTRARRAFRPAIRVSCASGHQRDARSFIGRVRVHGIPRLGSPRRPITQTRALLLSAFSLPSRICSKSNPTLRTFRRWELDTWIIEITGGLLEIRSVLIERSSREGTPLAKVRNLK